MSEAELPGERVPDFCAGFLYLLQPGLAGRLVQAGAELYSARQASMIGTTSPVTQPAIQWRFRFVM